MRATVMYAAHDVRVETVPDASIDGRRRESTAEQYRVPQESGTERPGTSE